MKFSESNVVYIRESIIEFFSLAELRIVISSLGDDDEVIASGATGKASLALKMIQWYKSRGRLAELWDAVSKERPFLHWELSNGDMPPETPKPETPEPQPEGDPDSSECWELLREQGRLLHRLQEITIRLMELDIKLDKTGM